MQDKNKSNVSLSPIDEKKHSYCFRLCAVIVIFLTLFIISGPIISVDEPSTAQEEIPLQEEIISTSQITLRDVAGIDDAVEEFQEISEFLKNPQKFTNLGARLPKGILLVGPPGTGKTLIAKAMAGSANCHFIHTSGSSFVNEYVGVGARNVRKLFKKARRHAPCIIFIDEIDSVGQNRATDSTGEYAQTLNQLLVEMDGFETTEGIIVIAATNQVEVLDKALLRPGRFDRQIYIPLPDIKGRFEILKIHACKIKLEPAVDLMQVARATSGYSGAHLEGALNEAAFIAARKNQKTVMKEDIEEALERVIFGKTGRNIKLDEQEKRATAYHESGHAIVAYHLLSHDTVNKVTIVAHGNALGATNVIPENERSSYGKRELVNQLAVLMAGRAAEEIFLNEVSTGIAQDIREATELAHNMVCKWGMGKNLGFSSYHQLPYSGQTEQEIDQEIRELLDEAYHKASLFILKNKDVVELMAKVLIEVETLDAKDISKIASRTWNSEDWKAKRLKDCKY